ncbi:hypothetical protein, partial [Novosphingobium sp.]|uniref:hypothetical protein n=1 Tax=Novosphingobium sp. TaxID=1874826 RepID=UPI00286E4EBD
SLLQAIKHDGEVAMSCQFSLLVRRVRLQQAAASFVTPVPATQECHCPQFKSGLSRDGTQAAQNGA